MDADDALRAAWNFDEGGWSADEIDEEYEKYLPTLIDAGYVDTEPWGDGFYLWSYSAAGIARIEALGLDTD